MEALAAKTDGLSKTDRMQLDFALGKAYADLKDHDRSFQHLLAGNAAKRATIAYDEAIDLRAVRPHRGGVHARTDRGKNPAAAIPRRCRSSSSACRARARRWSSRSSPAIPLVHGAGELQTLNDVVLDGARAGRQHAALSGIRAGARRARRCKQIGARYLAAGARARRQARARGRERITDKMPSNYYFAGLIHLALPNAQDHPHDPRSGRHLHLLLLETVLGRAEPHLRSRRARPLLQALRAADGALAPRAAGRAAFSTCATRTWSPISKAQARRIIAYCGLPWDDRCLSFHETDRPVRTASATQVRQPIYNSAIGRWRVYGISRAAADGAGRRR